MKFMVQLQESVKVRAFNYDDHKKAIDHVLPAGFTFTVESDPVEDLIRALQRKQ